MQKKGSITYKVDVRAGNDKYELYIDGDNETITITLKLDLLSRLTLYTVRTFCHRRSLFNIFCKEK